MTVFWAVTALALVVVLLQLARPFLWKSTASATSARQMNTAIYRDQLLKLEQDLSEGTLSPQDHAQAKAELQRRAIDETSDDPFQSALSTPKKTLLGLGLSLPLAAAALYLLIGNPAAMVASDMPNHAAAAQGTPPDIERMVASLAEKLEKEPDNLKGWTMLARSYKVMGRTAEAEKAFARAGAFVDDDAQLLASYADVVATNAGGNFTGKATQLIDKALKVDPDNAMALWLAGTAAMRRNDHDAAVLHWSRLAKLLPPDSEDAKMIQGAVTEARAKGGKGPALDSVTARHETASQREAAVVSAANVRGTVELDVALKAKAAPEDTVMVIARVPGNRMPVAVLRKRVAELPLNFTLDDSLSMSPQATLSAATEVEVEARISKSGMAKPEPGDLTSAVQTVKVGAQGLTLRVNKVRD